MILLASNENPLGMPESARRAAAAALVGAGNYPDSNGTALKNALAARLDVPADWLTLGSGSSEILHLAGQVSLKPGEGVVYSPSYAGMNLTNLDGGARALAELGLISRTGESP